MPAKPNGAVQAPPPAVDLPQYGQVDPDDLAALTQENFLLKCHVRKLERLLGPRAPVVVPPDAEA